MSSSAENSDHEEETRPAVQQDEEDENVLVVDINKPEPLSKKEKRLLKKGKISEDKTGLKKLSKKARKLHESNDDLVEAEESSEDENEPAPSKSKKSEYSVWIGNLSFDTSAADIKRFLVAKTSKNEEESEDNEDKVKITEKDITRVKLPLAPVRGASKIRKILGFAYVDLKSEAQVKTVVGLSEEQLNGRNLLIKNSKSFEGRPAVLTKSGDGKGTAISKNPPSRILFVGNLAFDTTESALEEHFQHCGDITRIRMATFEDSGNCKGFAFVDFRDVDGATEALTDKSCRKMGGRILRMEFGEDRSKRTKQEKFQNRTHNHNEESHEERKAPVERAPVESAPESYQERPKRKHDYKSNDRKSRDFGSNKRLKPGLALATAQRAKTSILPSAGKKITFD